jgi:quercetin dioxygenase-like cupin family protein
MNDAAIHLFNMNTEAWVPHNVFPAIATKVLETKATHANISLQVVKLEAGGSITKHIHPIETETAVVISGQVDFVWGEDAVEQVQTLLPNTGVTIYPGTLHCIRNNSTEPVELLAIHSPGVR